MTQYTPIATIPVINLNGSDGKALLELHRVALDHLRTAQKALMEAFPHGRDFQAAPPEAYKIAASQARARIVKLEEILIDVETIATGIFDQVYK